MWGNKGAVPRWGCMDSALFSTTDPQEPLFHPGTHRAEQPTRADPLPPELSHSPGHPHRLHGVLALFACGDVLHALGEPPTARLLTGALSGWPGAALPKEPRALGVRPPLGLGRTR